MRRFSASFLMILSTLLPFGAFSQQPEKKPVLETPSARLMSAKNVVVMRARGSDIPYDVIKSTLEGWGRLTLVETRDKADITVEIATTGGGASVRVASASGPSPLTGRIEESGSATRDLSDAAITMTVYDARNKRVLWVGTETAKSALKQTVRENNLVEAAERLASKFHDRLEPPLPKTKD